MNFHSTFFYLDPIIGQCTRYWQYGDQQTETQIMRAQTYGEVREINKAKVIIMMSGIETQVRCLSFERRNQSWVQGIGNIL